FYYNAGSLFDITLALEPILHRCSQLFERNATADFHHSIGNRQRLIKRSIVREIAHGEAIEPLQQARLALVVDLVLDGDSAGKHFRILSQKKFQARMLPRRMIPISRPAISLSA